MACSGTCWAACGASCSSGMVRSGGATSRRNNDQYNGTTRNSNGTGSRTGANGCWCGKDCAGCGGGCTGTSKTSGCSCSGCSGSCGGDCKDTCSGSCNKTCSGKCTTGCKGTCTGECLGQCKTACTGQCSHLCNISCVSDVAFNALKHLSKIKNANNLDFLDYKDADFLFKLLQEEGRRRTLKKKAAYRGDSAYKDDDYFKNNTLAQASRQSTSAEVLTIAEEKNIGYRDEDGALIKVIESDSAEANKHIKKLNSLLTTHAGKSISADTATLTQYGKISKKAGYSLVSKALEAAKALCSVNTTSNAAGKQEG